MRKLHPARLITVGDHVTADFLEAGIKPDIAIIDFLIMRFPADKKIKKVIDDYHVPTKRVKNPPSKITKELQDAVKDAVPPLKIIVEGEEDLATIPAILWPIWIGRGVRSAEGRHSYCGSDQGEEARDRRHPQTF